MIARLDSVWSLRPRTGIWRVSGYRTTSSRPNAFGSAPGTVTTKMTMRAVSCRRLDTCVTEFGAQGLELDATLLAWGTDLMLRDGRWTNERARGYQKRGRCVIRFNCESMHTGCYLTRGRDVCVVFVPPIITMDETFAYLAAADFGRFSPRRA